MNTPGTMDSQRWQQVRALFEEALTRPPEARAAFLEAACQGDADLRHEAGALLAAHEDASPFLDEPLSLGALLAPPFTPPRSLKGAHVGPYRVVEVLGHGGMGTVYLAERADGHFQQRVALKLVRQALHRRDLPERLRHERQILAALQHPHIARLLDGGLTEEGAPYLVMELVEGQPIDTFCNLRQLSTRERIALFRTVCGAVHYAHQNLVVHRDLKPSNILVTDDGQVKLLDFGIAKLLADEPDAVQTQTGLRAMTPAYAAPEQIRGEAVTTATDVYALGVILYELLTGRRPYDVQGLTPSAVERLICEQDPPRPSTAVRRAAEKDAAGLPRPRRLAGDLDTIVMTALRKAPARRYASAEQFGEDLRRHLARLPVRARPDTLGYRLSKFVRRNLVAVAAVALVALALVGGIVATTYQTRVAEQRFGQVRSLSNILLFDLHDAIRDLPGATPARQMLVSHAVAYLDSLRAGGDETLLHDLAEGYVQVGEIQGDPHYTNLGDLAGARESYQKAFDLRQELWLRDRTDAAARLALADSYGRLAVVTSWHGDNEAAIGMSRRGLALLDTLLAIDSPEADVEHVAGRIRSELGWWLIWAGQRGEGLRHLAASVARLEALAAQQPEHLDLHLHLWRAYSYQIDGYRFSRRHREALALLEDNALGRLHALEARHPTQPRVVYGLHVAYWFAGGQRSALGDLEGSLAAHRKSLGYAEALVAADTTNHKAYESLARTHLSLGHLHRMRDERAAARAAYEQALTVQTLLHTRNPDNHDYANALGLVYRGLCRMLLSFEEAEEALAFCLPGLAVMEIAAEQQTGNMVVLGNLSALHTYSARSHRALAERLAPAEMRRHHRTEALAHYERGLAAIAEAMEQSSGKLRPEIHPDSLAAEHAAYARSLGQ